MKKLLLMLLVVPSLCCGQKDGDNNPPGSNEIFEFSSSFKKSSTQKVQRYLSRKLGSGNVSFVNTELDATITLDNGMTFYIKSHPGKLFIRFDPAKNTSKNYLRMKETCEGLKDITGG